MGKNSYQILYSVFAKVASRIWNQVACSSISPGLYGIFHKTMGYGTIFCFCFDESLNMYKHCQGYQGVISCDPLYWTMWTWEETPSNLNSQQMKDKLSVDSYVVCLNVIITGDSEVIMFSPCVFVCVWLSVYVCHDVCPDDLTMKDWCHTNNILQVHCWGCLVVQVMFHALMTSLMTSQDHKVS